MHVIPGRFAGFAFSGGFAGEGLGFASIGGVESVAATASADFAGELGEGAAKRWEARYRSTASSIATISATFIASWKSTPALPPNLKFQTRDTPGV